MKRAAALALLLTLASCGQGDWTSMDCPAEPGVTTATITWQRSTDPAATCAALGAGATLERGGACITVQRQGGTTIATLYAEKPGVIDDAILGHEVKHAFGCKHGRYF